MKAIYKSIFFSVALLVGMVSCDKDELPPTGPQDNAEKLVVGTYSGAWTRLNVDTDEVVTGSGSITFSVSDAYSNNVSVITLDASGIDLGIAEPMTSVCNITRLSSGEFTYWNQTAANPFGVQFYGKVSPDGEATMTFSRTLKEGRKDVNFQFTFAGNKQ
ncbi:MAG: hypothetical protein J1F38_10580 [Muribaculaceae bacterium]|nr:hypothetical protein [Muribaculaceae bacterium]